MGRSNVRSNDTTYTDRVYHVDKTVVVAKRGPDAVHGVRA